MKSFSGTFIACTKRSSSATSEKHTAQFRNSAVFGEAFFITANKNFIAQDARVLILGGGDGAVIHQLLKLDQCSFVTAVEVLTFVNSYVGRVFRSI